MPPLPAQDPTREPHGLSAVTKTLLFIVAVFAIAAAVVVSLAARA